MAKKSKKNNTQEAAPAPEQEKKKIEKAPKPAKKSGKSKQEGDLQLFSPAFYETLNSFKDYYKEVLELKAKSNTDTDVDTEIEKVSKTVSQKLQSESRSILRTELTDLESWIQKQRVKLDGQIKKSQEALSEMRSKLQGLNLFNEAQIKNQTNPLESKIKELNGTYENYGELLKRAGEIYK